MYTTIHDLPPQVRLSLDEHDQKIWMNRYNSFSPQTADGAMDARKAAWHACAKLPSSFSFESVAAADVTDDEHEQITTDSVAENIDALIDHGGNIQNSHRNYTIGTIWDWKRGKVRRSNGKEVGAIIVYGNIFGGTPTYDAAREGFLRRMNSLSVAGEASLGHRECTEEGCYIKRDLNEILEISLVTNPSNHYARLRWYNDKAAVAKASSADPGETVLGLGGISVHKDYTVCPHQALKRCLENIGYEDGKVHVRSDGCFVEMDRDEFLRDLPHMNAHGLRAAYRGNGCMIRDEDRMIESAFRKGYGEGWIDGEGNLLSPSREQFDSLYMNGLLTWDNRLKCPSTRTL